MEKLNQAITGICSFGKYPICLDIDNINANFAILGAPYDSSVGFMPGSRLGPRRIREASTQYGRGNSGFYNYETNEQLLESPGIVDCGDADIQAGQHEFSHKNIEMSVRKILRRGVIPVILGGDHSVTIAVGRALEELKGKVSIVQFDCHLDFSDHIGDFYESPGSPMRRLSEMNHIDKITQIGIRGMGSSKRTDFDDARTYGTLITSKEVHSLGAVEVAALIPESEKYYITIDIDGFDMSIAPGTCAPYPGGLLFDEVIDIISEICKKGDIVGFDLVEVAPQIDPSGITARLGALVVINTIAQILKYKRIRLQSSGGYSYGER
ncbi:MAG: agmatinase [Synergistaceae bacterium]|nr:agmatinase [Synergistaceae bacterium]